MSIETKLDTHRQKKPAIPKRKFHILVGEISETEDEHRQGSRFDDDLPILDARQQPVNQEGSASSKKKRHHLHVRMRMQLLNQRRGAQHMRRLEMIESSFVFLRVAGVEGRGSFPYGQKIDDHGLEIVVILVARAVGLLDDLIVLSVSRSSIP